MARFTQFTQAATCPCLDRGYVIDGNGDFAACGYCEAGEAFAAKLAQVKAEAEVAPELAPVVAGPARVVPSVERRVSAKLPGLVLERQGNVLTFRVGLGFIKYDVTGGQLRVLEAMDGGYIMPTERAHIVETAKRYAQRAA